MTPLISTAVAIGASVLAIAGLVSPPFEVITLAVTIALLGPGAFSLDARMFGRREILVPNTSRSSKS
jgi:putative oxidoreductase